jgi:hypothetical protein
VDCQRLRFWFHPLENFQVNHCRRLPKCLLCRGIKPTVWPKPSQFCLRHRLPASG